MEGMTNVMRVAQMPLPAIGSKAKNEFMGFLGLPRFSDVSCRLGDVYVGM